MLPLEGIRVIDFTEVWAGPMGMTLLGDMGAEVIKVESFPRAPNTRPPVALPAAISQFFGPASAPRPWDRYAIHNMANRNKIGMTLNLRHPRGMELAKTLLRTADVAVNSYSAGTIEGLGLGYDVVSALNPGLIMMSLPGWGVDGPYKGYVTLGSGIDAYVGHHALRAYPDMDVTSANSCVHSDAVAAVTAAFAVLVALQHRRKTGRGQYIDVSQAETLVNHLPYAFFDWVFNQRRIEPIGNRDRAYVPHGLYPCVGEDAWVTIAVTNEAEFAALCRAIGQPGLVEDARFATVPARWANQDDLDEIIAAWTQARTPYDAMYQLQDAGVPAGAVLNNKQIFEDPHYVARQFFPLVEHPLAGTHRYPGMLWRYTKTPMSVRLRPSMLGEHNRDILCGLLGVTEEELAELERDGVIGTEYAPDAGQ